MTVEILHKNDHATVRMLYSRLHDVLYEHGEGLTVATIIGVLETLKHEFLLNEAVGGDSDGIH